MSCVDLETKGDKFNDPIPPFTISIKNLHKIMTGQFLIKAHVILPLNATRTGEGSVGKRLKSGEMAVRMAWISVCDFG